MTKSTTLLQLRPQQAYLFLSVNLPVTPLKGGGMTMACSQAKAMVKRYYQEEKQYEDLYMLNIINCQDKLGPH